MLLVLAAPASAVREPVWHELPLLLRVEVPEACGQDFREAEPQDGMAFQQQQDFRTAVASSEQAFAESLRSSAVDWLDHPVDRWVGQRVEAGVAAVHEEQRAG